MNKLLALFIFTTLLSIAAKGQNVQQKIPLATVLDTVATRYDVKFSYADQYIADVFLTPPSDKLSIEQTLEYLSKTTGLQFQLISQNQVVVSLKPETKLPVCGVITDGKTPLPGAAISTRAYGVVADDAGFFSFQNLSEEDVLTISYLGYYDKVIHAKEIAGQGCDTIRLRQQVMKLQEMIIRNYMTKGINISSDGNYQISAGALGILPGLTDPDVLQTVQALPGITSLSETVSDINIRGGTNDQNLILWDGIKMYQSGHFFGLISSFNPYLADEIRLIKNGTSSAIGDGVSGVIDIQTDDEVNGKFSGGAGINMINADAFLKIPVSRNFDLHLAGRGSISNLLQTPTYDAYFNRVFKNTEVSQAPGTGADSLADDDQEFRFFDLTAKALYDISDRDKLRLSFMLFENTLEYQENAYTTDGLESKTSSLEQGSMVGSMSYKRTWSEVLETNIQAYASSYLLSGINQNLQKNQRLLQENEVLESGVKFDVMAGLSQKTDLQSGYQFNETGVSNLEDINNPVYRRLIKKVLRSHALFSELNHKSASGNTFFRAGLRLNYFEKFNLLRLEPRLAFNQRFMRHFSFEVLGEMKSQGTAQIIDLQKDFLGVEKRRWYLADNEEVPIIRSNQLSGGLRYQRDRILLSAEGYHRQVEGISSLSQGFQNQFQYARTTGSYTVTGIDALFNVTYHNLNTWIGYAWAVNDYQFPEFIPPGFPNNLDVRHSVSLGASYQTQHVQTSAGLHWRSGKPYTVATGVESGRIVYDDPNAMRLPEYIRLDFSAKYLFNLSAGIRGELGASVWNVLNHDNMINWYYRLDDGGNLETIKQYALGFTPNVMMRVNF